MKGEMEGEMEGEGGDGRQKMVEGGDGGRDGGG